MKKLRCMFVLLLVFTCLPHAQQNKNTWLETIPDQFASQLDLFPQEKIYAHLDRYFYKQGDTVWFKLYLIDATTHIRLETEQIIYVELVNSQDTVVERVKIGPIDNNYYGYLPLSQELGSGTYQFRVYAPYMLSSDDNYFFRRNIYLAGGAHPIEVNTLDFDVTFHPEGGCLIPGVQCVVGFKSINENGLGEWVEGEIYDETDEPIVSMKSNHLGMGICAFTPEIGKNYYALCSNVSGVKKRFELPSMTTNTYSLQAKWLNEKLIITILHSVDREDINKDLYVLLHTRGVVHAVLPWDPQKKFMAFNKENFPSGVLHVILFDADKDILSERLLFCMNDADIAQVTFHTDKTSYHSREKIVSEIKLTDYQGNPLSGNMSVSITDTNAAYIDTTVTIATHLLLSSELKGFIENPSYYFQPNNRSALIELDYLMLTQGWRRYNINKVLREKYESPYVTWDGGQYVSGTVYGGFNKSKIEGAKVTIISSLNDYMGAEESDKDGRFSFLLPNNPEGTSYRIQVTPPKKIHNVEVEIDEVTYPIITSHIPETLLCRIKPEDDMRTVNLSEVEVKARKRINMKPRSVYTKIASHTITKEELDKEPNLTWERVLKNIPGTRIERVNVKESNSYIKQVVFLRYAGVAAGIMVDDVLMSAPYDLDDIDLYNVEQIDIIKGPSANVIAGKPIISVTTKSSSDFQNEKDTDKNIYYVTPLGCQVAEEFYSPRYDVENLNLSLKDLRTTLLWYPNIQTDKKGTFTFDFYSSDTGGSYTVLIEGLTDNGKVIYRTAEIKNR